MTLGIGPVVTVKLRLVEPPRRASLTAALAPILDALLTPALVIDLDAVAHNLKATLERVGGPRRWRPHLKTSKQAVVIELMLAAGLRQFKVATIDELDLLLRAAVDNETPAIDVLFAYPPSRASLRAVLALERASEARLVVLADSPAHLEQLARGAADFDGRAPLPVMLDVDLGMGRTGTTPDRWRSLTAVPVPLQLVGLHGYDGHLRWDQRDQAQLGYDRLCELASELAAALTLEAGALELLTSGTHSYAHALDHERLRDGPWEHRVSPGTVVFSDLRSHAAHADIGLRQAAYIATRVISVGPGRVTCDAGSKAITPDGTPPVCAVLGHPELTPQRASEEHLPCAVAEGAAGPELGELLWLIPDHVCTTVNLHREAVWLRDGRFAGFGPIAAAGHRPRPPTREPV